MLRLDELDLFVIATQAEWYRPGRPLDGVLGHEHSYVLTGSVRQHTGGARITVRIIEPRAACKFGARPTTSHPASSSSPELQAKWRATRRGGRAVRPGVRRPSLRSRAASAHTLELPDCQMRYLAYRRETDPALFPEAAACFQSLVARSPTLAQAWAGLAMLCDR